VKKLSIFKVEDPVEKKQEIDDEKDLNKEINNFSDFLDNLKMILNISGKREFYGENKKTNAPLAGAVEEPPPVT
jgi:hypothetical protein